MLTHMRTTIDLDADLSIEIDRIAQSQGRTKKEVIHDLLRRGLASPEESRTSDARFATRARDLGECRLPGIDDISEVLAVSEGEAFK